MSETEEIRILKGTVAELAVKNFKLSEEVASEVRNKDTYWEWYIEQKDRAEKLQADFDRHDNTIDELERRIDELEAEKAETDKLIEQSIPYLMEHAEEKIGILLDKWRGNPVNDDDDTQL